MIDPADLDRKTAHLLELSHDKFGVKARTLDKAMSRLGRRVPKHVHRQAAKITEAQRLAGHPKLMMMADPAAVDTAYAVIRDHLKTVDPADRRKGKILDLLGSLSLNLIGVFILLIAVLLWRGYL